MEAASSKAVLMAGIISWKFGGQESCHSVKADIAGSGGSAIIGQVCGETVLKDTGMPGHSVPTEVRGGASTSAAHGRWCIRVGAAGLSVLPGCSRSSATMHSSTPCASQVPIVLLTHGKDV